MKILITGSSGLVGGRLSYFLLNKGTAHDSRKLSLKKANAATLKTYLC